MTCFSLSSHNIIIFNYNLILITYFYLHCKHSIYHIENRAWLSKWDSSKLNLRFQLNSFPAFYLLRFLLSLQIQESQWKASERWLIGRWFPHLNRFWVFLVWPGSCFSSHPSSSPTPGSTSPPICTGNPSPNSCHVWVPGCPPYTPVPPWSRKKKETDIRITEWEELFLLLLK